MKSLRVRMTPTRIIALGFVAVILLGALLLCLPIATKSGHPTAFVDALFTATSATCVTGLAVFDTFQYWSLFGQIVILVLIQIGGLGFVSFTILLYMLLNKRIGLKSRNLMQEAVNAPQLGGIVRLTRFILTWTVIIELTGAVLLSIAFVPKFGWGKGIYFGIFHSISAFCNAGFDLMGAAGTPYVSLGDFRGSILVNLVIMGLIIIGGLGFFVWHDIRSKGFHFRRYALHTKIVLVTTLLLILLPAIFFFFYESHNGAFQNMTAKEQVLASFFQSVTARTAGFCTVDMASMKDASLFILIALMFIGGSPGSTAGGLKTTTFAILVLATVSFVRRKESAECFGRRFEAPLLRRCVALFMILAVCVSICMGVLMVADDIPLRDAAFESVSAIATVGLSLGITPGLSSWSKVALLLLMFIGRVGCLTLLFSLKVRPSELGRSLPMEHVSVG